MLWSRLRKPVLPEWRYWPGVMLVLLLALSIAAYFLGPAPAPPTISTPSHGPDSKVVEWIVGCLSSAAFWTAIFTLALTLSTIGLWLQTKRLAEGAEDQSKKMAASIEVAQLAAEAAQKSAKVAEQTLIAANRPWISVRAHTLGPLVFSEDRVYIHLGITLRNVGTAPATKLKCFAEMHGSITKAAEIGQKWERNGLSKLSDSGEVIFHGGEVFQERDIELKIEDFRQEISRFEAYCRESDPLATVTHGNPAIWIMAVYEVPTDDGWKLRHTSIYYIVSDTRKTHPGWDGNPQTIGADKFRLDQRIVSGSVT